MSPAPTPMGRLIQELREGRGMSRAQLAEAAGITREYVRRVEAGLQDPTRGALQKIVRALEVRMIDLDLLLENATTRGTADLMVFRVRRCLESGEQPPFPRRFV